MKKEKKSARDITKLKTKKYTLTNCWGVLVRQILIILIILISGGTIGGVTYFLAVNNIYTTECTIVYEGNDVKNDTYKEWIANYIVCNETIDKYTKSLSNNNIRKPNNTEFLFADIASGLSATYDAEHSTADNLKFVVTYSYNIPNYSSKVLKVICTRASQELTNIGNYSGTFYADVTTFTQEYKTVARNRTALIVPISIAFIVSIITAFILDGYDDHLYDLSDTYDFSDSSIKIKKNMNYAEIFDDKSTYIIDEKDEERVKKILDAILENNQLKVKTVKDINEKTKGNLTYLAVIGRSKYSTYYKNNKALEQMGIRLDRTILFDTKLIKNEGK